MADKTAQKAWRVYALKSPDSGEVRYVGSTGTSLLVRLAGHASGYKRDRAARNRWLTEVVDRGLVPVMEMLESGFGDGRFLCERKWIDFYLKKGAKLTNAISPPGGKHLSGPDHDSKTCYVPLRMENDLFGEIDTGSKRLQIGKSEFIRMILKDYFEYGTTEGAK